MVVMGELPFHRLALPVTFIHNASSYFTSVVAKGLRAVRTHETALSVDGGVGAGLVERQGVVALGGFAEAHLEEVRSRRFMSASLFFIQ
jgi:hypothetical protein